jgi:ribonuclease BN (tRNA processing enzyme)
VKIRVLGVSGSEIPGRNLPAFLIDDTMLLDAGTIGQSLDSRAQSRITHILLSHAHLDHIKGLPFLLDNMIIKNFGGTLTVLSAGDVLADVKNNLLNDKIWPDFTRIPNTSKPVLKFRTINPSRQVTVNGYSILCEKMTHTVPAYGYIIGQKGKKTLAYTGDTGPTEVFWQKVSRHKVDCLIVETSFPDSLIELALKTGHLTPALLKIELGKMKNLPSRIYITHAKPLYLKDIQKEIKSLRIPGMDMLVDKQIFTV